MEMMVVSAATAEAEYQVSSNGYAPDGEVKKGRQPADKDPVMELMERVSMLCNDAKLFQAAGELPRNLVLIGLIGLFDPPRKEAIEAGRACHGGGIRVTMITGDHRITAAAIAKMLGIGDGIEKAILFLFPTNFAHALVIFAYAPPLQAVFGNEAMPLYVWSVLSAGGAVFFLIVELEKFIIRSSASLRPTVTAVEAGI